jgi:hypothetical protein
MKTHFRGGATPRETCSCFGPKPSVMPKTRGCQSEQQSEQLTATQPAWHGRRFRVVPKLFRSRGIAKAAWVCDTSRASAVNFAMFRKLLRCRAFAKFALACGTQTVHHPWTAKSPVTPKQHNRQPPLGRSKQQQRGTPRRKTTSHPEAALPLVNPR